MLKVQQGDPDKAIGELAAEYQMMSKVFTGLVKTGICPLFVMPYGLVANQLLMEHLVPLSDAGDWTVDIAVSVLAAVLLLATHLGIQHRDIHQNNVVLIKDDGPGDYIYWLDDERAIRVPKGRVLPILIDFGMAKEAPGVYAQDINMAFRHIDPRNPDPVPYDAYDEHAVVTVAQVYAALPAKYRYRRRRRHD